MCEYYLVIFTIFYGIQFFIVNGLPTKTSISMPSTTKIDSTELNEAVNTRFYLPGQKLYPLPIYYRDQTRPSTIIQNENSNNEFSKPLHVNHLQNRTKIITVDEVNTTLTETLSTKESDKKPTIVATANIKSQKIENEAAVSFHRNPSTIKPYEIHRNSETLMTVNTTQKLQNIGSIIFPNDDYLDYDDDRISSSAIASILG